jgi:hypothetical protein
VVSLIIIPKTKDDRPEPSVALLKATKAYVDLHRDPASDLVVVGPNYIRVAIKVELAVTGLEGAGGIVFEVGRRLRSFLHPLSGGPAGRGWRFGQVPHQSELVALCAATPGVDHTVSLRTENAEDIDGLFDSGNFLIYSGEHEVKVVQSVTR